MPPTKKAVPPRVNRDPKGEHIPMTEVMTVLGRLGSLLTEVSALKDLITEPRNDLQVKAFDEQQKSYDILRVQGVSERNTWPLHRVLRRKGREPVINRRYQPIKPQSVPKHMRNIQGVEELSAAIEAFKTANTELFAPYEVKEEKQD